MINYKKNGHDTHNNHQTDQGKGQKGHFEAN